VDFLDSMAGPAFAGGGGGANNAHRCSFKGGYRSALMQTVILGFIFFFLPGGYNAINSMAGGMPKLVDAFARGNAWLNSLFAVCSLFAPVVVNILGPRVTLFFGSLGYPFYICALLMAGKLGIWDENMITISSALLGVCAALVWTAQGGLIMAYPSPDLKGSYFALFWIIFNAGGVVNSFFISFLLNLKTTGAASAVTYYVFIGVMLLGTLLCCTLVPLSRVLRPDNSEVKVEANPRVVPEIMGMFKLLTDPRSLALIPMMLFTNWCYAYQFNVYNEKLFDTPTKGLNNTFYWGTQMIGAYFLGQFLDSTGSINKVRAKVSLGFCTLFILMNWFAGVAVHYLNDLSTVNEQAEGLDIRFSDLGRWFLPMLVYFFWGCSDALMQCWCYWIMGQLADKPEVLSRYAGLYKCFNSAGAALGNVACNATGATNQLWINIVLFLVALPSSYWVAANLEERSTKALADKLETLENGDVSSEKSGNVRNGLFAAAAELPNDMRVL